MDSKPLPQELTRYYPGKGGPIVVLPARPLAYEAAEKCLSTQSQKACFGVCCDAYYTSAAAHVENQNCSFTGAPLTRVFVPLAALPARPLILKIIISLLPAWAFTHVFADSLLS